MMWKMLRSSSSLALVTGWWAGRATRIADARDLEQVLQPERHGDLEHVLILAQAELGGEHAAAHRVHALFHLEPHDRRERRP